ncbi:cation:proton antiporter [Odoribacter sp. Z80]|uniref:cation:proton antiporter n=1 Tax=Odoribacter sp. Z80 TaxID=2304575 RepID=UPI00137AE0EB|nr:cation:proton antiporter [Odoribacter sp. Z80]NCE71424.1 cation:proton antiporter [Odoribacter sp. Z80]
MMLPLAISHTLPLTDPVLKFLIILVIIIAAPLLLNKLKIPHLLGLIIAGAIIGPYGLNLILRDSSIILSGTAGLLYIMFLAGLEIDMGDFKKNSGRSFVFGMYTFLIPMGLGIIAGYYLLHFSMDTSILLASMFASHTLIAYPIISKLGIAKDKSVTITVGGTMITDMLALLVLTVIVGMATGQIGKHFWTQLSISVVVFVLFIILLFPLLSRWFFKRVQDSISQYVFVLIMVFLGAYLAELAGIESIIGSFLAGLSLNRLIPRSSPLMHRVEFIGNAIFIPFFLISVGMLIDYRAFFTSFDTVKVGIVMIIVATLAKFAAAWLTQKTFRMSADQRRIIFGLSNAQAAATLAAVMVGYNVILGQTPDGQPIRLLNESILNGTILMILVTCTMASFSAQKGAHNIAAHNSSQEEKESSRQQERILIPINNEDTAEELINLSLATKSKKNSQYLYALHILDNQASANEQQLKKSHRLLENAALNAAATDTHLQKLMRYDLNVTNAILSTILEHKITDLILGLHKEKGIPGSFLGRITEGVLEHSDVTTFIYKPAQPLSTMKRHLIVVPAQAEKEAGFNQWVERIRQVIQNTGAKTIFYASSETGEKLKSIFKTESGKTEFIKFSEWEDFLIVFRDVHPNDNLWIIMSRSNGISYTQQMNKIPVYLNKYFQQNSFILIYPFQVNAVPNRYFI